jgi:aminopeptidase N
MTVLRLLTAVCVGVSLQASADTYPKNPNVDALNYAFRIDLSDDTDEISVELAMDVRFQGEGVTTLRLDLANADPAPGGKGMTVTGVMREGQLVEYTHANDVLLIALSPVPAENERRRYRVAYKGIPASGLKIAMNKHGDRTFYSDNWPDKARHWLAVIDHPYDKAASEFIVTAPSHYQVVSNGLRIETSDLPGGTRLTHWKNSVPIAPWLYVLGVARMAMQTVDTFDGKAIETWVYPQDRDIGFLDFSEPTRKVLEFYSGYVGPFAYERLANIQSNSVSGGMEAASAIFYTEGSVTGKKDTRLRGLVIHEIAHQWFGNAVTEHDWDDVWLSEGFATYFTLLFVEHAYGRDEFLKGLEKSRKTVMNFHAKNPQYTIIHENLDNMADVTSSHTYQKGSWVLHMLRGIVGEENFRNGIRSYYARHFNANATTADFRRAMEGASGQDLGWFFDQWLYKPGELRLSGAWTYDSQAKQVMLTLDQTQAGDLFRMPMEVGLHYEGEDRPVIEKIQVSEESAAFTFASATRPEALELDPNVWVLMEGEVIHSQ